MPKITKGATYVHRSAIGCLPDNFQTAIADAAKHIEPNTLYNVIKVAHNGDVSFLEYVDFDTDPHPGLFRSILVRANGEVTTPRRYTNNPPVLHRKELFVDTDYRWYVDFVKLTRAEKKAGLLVNPPGFSRQWNQKLKRAGYKITGHKLEKIGE